MTMAEQQQKYLKARVALALYSEFGHVPKEDEIEHVYHLTRVLYKAVLGTHYLRKQKKGERAIGAVLGPRTKGQAC